jgi:hypothetical protein
MHYVFSKNQVIQGGHVQVIDVTTDRINSFKSACQCLIYDFNQDGYDVTVEIKDGEQFPNKLDNFVYFLRNSAIFGCLAHVTI